MRTRSTLLALSLLLAAAVPAAAEEVKETHELLGASVDIRVESEDAETGQNRIRDAVTIAHRLEAQLTEKDGSELAQLSAAAGLGPRHVGLDLYRLLALSRVMTRSTGGAFDVTVGPLLKRRQAAANERGGRLAVEEALTLVGADKIELQPPDQAELTDAGMSVDFGAILRGYMLERMAASLKAAGIRKALIEFGDQLVLAIGPPDGEEPFRVWVARGKGMAGSVALRDRSLSISRTVRRGDESTHDPIVDPRSGRFVETERQATVVALDAAIADAWSTALVVDPDGALGLLEEPRDVEALVFDEHGEHASPRFASFAGWKPGRKSAAAVDAGREGSVPAPATRD